MKVIKFTNSAAKMKTVYYIDDNFPISEATRKNNYVFAEQKTRVQELTRMSILGQREGLQR